MVSNELIQSLEGATRRAILRTKIDEARARFRESTVYAFNGGLFDIRSAFLLDVEFSIKNLWDCPGPMILLDRDGHPVELMDPHQFLEDATRKLRSALTRFNMDVKMARETFIPDLLDVCAE